VLLAELPNSPGVRGCHVAPAEHDTDRPHSELATTKKSLPGSGKSPADEKLKALQKDYDELSAKYNASAGAGAAAGGSKKSN
jgi:hypothetical protein